MTIMNISYVSWTSFSSNKSLTYISKTFTLEWKSIYYVTKTIYMHKYIEKHIHIKWKSILYIYPNILIKLRRHGKNCTPFSFKLARVLTLHLLMLCGSQFTLTQLAHVHNALTCPRQAPPNFYSSNFLVYRVPCGAFNPLNHHSTLL